MPRTRPAAGSSGSQPSSPSRPGRGEATAPPRAATGTQLWGTRPGRLGVFAVLAAALLGMVITLGSGTGPGAILGVFLVAGTILATLAVRPGATYLIFPVPALAYAVAAVLAGLVHDRAADNSLTALLLHAGQWIAGGFIPMTVATAAAVLIAGYRWLRAA